MKTGWLALCSICVICASIPAHSSLVDDRTKYKQALKALKAGKLDSFNKSKESLQDYVLYPYLEYAELTRKLSSLKNEDVHNFRQAWSDSPLAERLYSKWLTRLAKNGEWQRYLDQYETGSSKTKKCYYLRALYHTGKQQQAMANVAQLWTSSKSLPKACDPLFATWIANHKLTNDIAWQRLKLALGANNKKLASYLLRHFKADLKRTSSTFYQVHKHPTVLANHKRFSPDTLYVRDVIAHGIVRWANFDPLAAREAWNKYALSHTYSPFKIQSILQDIQIRMARKNILPVAENVIDSPDSKHELVVEAIAQAALRSQSWPQAVYWIDRLPDQVRAKMKWRYWSARATLNQSEPSQLEKDLALVKLELVATTRTYYGFLASHALGLEPKLNNQLSLNNETINAQISTMPAIQRALELYATNKVISATREWYLLTTRLSKPELAAAAKLAAQAGWLNQSIRTANLAELRNDLSLRFPTPYREIFAREATLSKVPEHLLYGIGRQESAFAPAVRSSAGALGLMQLMLPTAAETARKAGLKAPTPRQLLKPEMNVKLGSRYMSALLSRYHGNRAVAAAAYNAGPSRADRWLRGNAANPIDLWIESIPYKETRNYVKNVLAFTYIFSQHLEQKIPFLSASEAQGFPQYVLLDKVSSQISGEPAEYLPQ